jgi:hypothetical protein
MAIFNQQGQVVHGNQIQATEIAVVDAQAEIEAAAHKQFVAVRHAAINHDKQIMQQVAPYPWKLQRLVDHLRYKPGWEFALYSLDRGQGSEGLTLQIVIAAPDTNDLDRTIHVAHFMIVPAASYNEESWRRWLFDQILLVEQHEAMEFFKVYGVKPFAPLHGEGQDPYRIAELTTAEDRAKTFRDA